MKSVTLSLQFTCSVLKARRLPLGGCAYLKPLHQVTLAYSLDFFPPEDSDYSYLDSLSNLSRALVFERLHFHTSKVHFHT